jgi:hypothetical protein
MKILCFLIVNVFVFVFLNCYPSNPVSTSQFQSSTTQALFPLAIGNSWTLTSETDRNSGTITTITISIIGDTVWNNVQYFLLHETYGDTTKPYIYFARIDSLNRIVLVEGGVRQYVLDPAAIEPNQVYVNGIYNITVTHPDTVTTKVAELNNCIDFYIDAPQICDEETGYVFSPGIGIVRMYGSWGRDYRLVSNIIRQ